MLASDLFSNDELIALNPDLFFGLDGKKKKRPKRHKFNAVETVVDGVKFGSTGEANRYIQLKMLLAAGEISDLKLQHPTFILQPGFQHPITKRKFRQIAYTADFSYKRKGQEHLVVEDYKGVETKEFKIKWKIVQYLHIDTDIEFRLEKAERKPKPSKPRKPKKAKSRRARR